MRHQREVGVGYFDAVAVAASGGMSSTTAMAGSTETAQFHEAEPEPEAPSARGGAGIRQPALSVSAHDDYDDGIVHGHEWARGASLNV
jgi:isocitrate lyase